MNQSILSVRVNAEDKKSFEKFCNDTGMNVSTAINMFIKAVLRDNRLPFEIKTVSSDEDIYEALKEAEEEMENSTKRYTEEEGLKSMYDAIGK